jgi:hypothetical protein
MTPVSGQLLSDATGLIHRLDVQTSGYDFEIQLTSNFDIDDYTFDKDQKQLTLYFTSNLENNLAEIIMPSDLLSGNFIFYLNDQEFFPLVQSNEKINFITLNFTGSGPNVIAISASEYLSGLTEIISIENKTSEDLDNDFLPPDRQFDKTSFDDYLVWLIVGGVVIVIAVFVVTKFLKNKN